MHDLTTRFTVGGAPSAINDSSRFSANYRSSIYGEFVTRQLNFGRIGPQLLEVAQPEGSYSTAGTSDFVLGLVINPGVRARMDFGDGAFAFDSSSTPLFLSPAGVPSRVQADAWHHAVLLSIPQADGDRIFAEADLGYVAQFARLYGNGIDDPFVAATMRQIALLSDEGAGSRLFAESATIALVLSLARTADVQRNQQRVLQRGGLSPHRLRQAQALLGENLSEDILLADVATLVGQSTFHFCRAFKQSTGVSPYRWRLRRRISHACHLLATTQLSVPEIAAMVGYESPRSFSVVFRREMRLTPGAYRARAG